MKKILVVDDSATSRLLFKAHLPKDSGYEVVEAKNMAEALEKAAADRPDIAFLDYNMPDHNGVEIAGRLREAGFDAPCYLLTANTQHSVLAEAEQAHFVGVLEKPITREKLQQVLGGTAA